MSGNLTDMFLKMDTNVVRGTERGTPQVGTLLRVERTKDLVVTNGHSLLLPPPSLPLYLPAFQNTT